MSNIRFSTFNLKNKYKNNKVFLTQLISYIMVLLIPVVSLTILIYHQVSNTLKNEIINSNIVVLSKVSESINMKMKEVSLMVDIISINPKLTPYELSKSAYTNYDAIKVIGDYVKINSIISDVFIYVYDKEYIHSSKGTYPLNVFTDILFNYSNWSKNDFYYQINNLKVPSIRAAEDIYIDNQYNKISTITYLSPIPKSNPYGTILVHIPEKNIKNMIENVLKDYDGATVIVDNDGNIITSSGDERSKLIFENFKENKVSMLEKTKKDQSGSFDFKINKSKYIASFIRSQDTNWTIITMVSTNKVLESVLFIKKITIVVILFILLFGILGINLFMKLNYNPIKNIRENLTMLVNSDNAKYDDFYIINATLDDIVHTNSNLKEKIDKNQIIIKEKVLNLLISGQSLKDEAFLANFEDANLILDKEFLCVCVVQPFKDSIENKYNNQDEIKYEVVSISNDKIALIINSSQRDLIYGFLDHLKTDLQNDGHTNVFIGVGNIYNQLDYVYNSYTEALQALNYSQMKGNKSIVYFDNIDLTKNSGETWYPMEDIKNIEISIKQGDSDRCISLIKDIINTIIDGDISLHIAKCYCFDIINTITKVMYELNIEFDTLKGDIPTPALLSQFETLPEFEKGIEKLYIGVCDFVREHSGSKNENLKNDLIDYVVKEFANINFNTKQMADEFNLSQSYLSRYFKEQVGQTIIEYLTELRMKEAKVLLQYTNTPIKDIVSKVGYVDVANFNRKFKLLQGISPSQYRKLTNN